MENLLISHKFNDRVISVFIEVDLGDQICNMLLNQSLNELVMI